LKDGEAEQYKGVEVEYVHGRKAVLTIYKDGEQQDEVTLSDYRLKTEMHALMVEKGFVKKSNEELAEIEARREATRQKDWQKRKEQREKNYKVQDRLKEAQEERVVQEKQRTQQRREERKRRVEHRQEQVEQEL
jgi:hypothetical protein